MVERRVAGKRPPAGQAAPAEPSATANWREREYLPQITPLRASVSPLWTWADSTTPKALITVSIAVPP